MKAPDLELFQSDPQKAVAEYRAYYTYLMEQTDGMPPFGLMLAAENLDFHKIIINE